MAPQTRNASRKLGDQSNASTKDVYVECTCREGPPLYGNAFAACRKCGTMHHKFCILQTPTKTKYIGESECLRCNRRNRRNRQDSDVRGIEEWPATNVSPNEQPRSSSYLQQRSTRPRLERIEQSATRRCDCRNGVQINDTDLVACDSCSNLHHSTCVTSDDASDTFSPRHCGPCRAKIVHGLMLRQERIRRIRGVLDRKRSQAQDLYAVILWRHYCNLPNGDASEAVTNATKVKFERGTMVPVHAAPQDWIEGVQSAVAKMTKDAGEKAKHFIDPETSSTSLDSKLLMQWRELAWWMLHRGPYKRRTIELGILAEVLGFDEKGAVWKG